MKICKTKPIRIIPTLLYPILAGYHGLDGGLGISWLGYLLKIVLPRVEHSESLTERLAHAAGALSDIEILVTSCVSVNASKETHKLAEAVLRRILASAHARHCIPSWFVHEWERRLWEEFELGHIHACGKKGEMVDGDLTITIVVSTEELAALDRHMGTRLIMLATRVDKKDVGDIVLARVHQAALKVTMEMDLTK